MQQNILVHQPNTPAGHAAYTQQLSTYKTRHGDSFPDERRPYPLTPGTEPLHSGACYNCAQSGHMAKDREGNATCPNPGAIPEPERRWRNTAGHIYRTSRRTIIPTEIRYIDTPAQPFYDPSTDSWFTLDYGGEDYAHAYGDNQGKGQGSSE
jgi:hypothetical protein